MPKEVPVTWQFLSMIVGSFVAGFFASSEIIYEDLIDKGKKYDEKIMEIKEAYQKAEAATKAAADMYQKYIDLKSLEDSRPAPGPALPVSPISHGPNPFSIEERSRKILEAREAYLKSRDEYFKQREEFNKFLMKREGSIFEAERRMMQQQSPVNGWWQPLFIPEDIGGSDTSGTTTPTAPVTPTTTVTPTQPELQAPPVQLKLRSFPKF